jgi:hypothetical protein
MFTRNIFLQVLMLFVSQTMGIACADTLKPLPVQMRNKMDSLSAPNYRIPPNSPATIVDLKSIPVPSASFSQIPVVVSVRGNDLVIGGYLVMTERSEIYIDISPRTYPGSIPSGRYLVRANMSNVGSANTMVMEGAGNSAACPMQVRPGYQNIQPCELLMDTNGNAELVVRLRSKSANQITLDSVQVFKVQ